MPNMFELPPTVEDHVREQLFAKSWEEHCAVEYEEHLLFPDTVNKRKSDGSVEVIQVIVDGNNVFMALGLNRSAEAEQFLQQLELAAVNRDWEVTVFFDGPSRYLPRESGPLVVQYAQGAGGADRAIERMVSVG